MADPRGNLALTYLAIADRYRPRWLVWENVPGVLSSNGGRDFGSFLGALVKLGYGFSYRVLDAQFFGVAQRRRRVFVVGYLGDWRRAAAVLFERESLRGDPPPSREARQDVAGALTSRASGGGGGPGAGTDEAAAGYLQPVTWPAKVAPTLYASFGVKMGLEDQHALGGAGLFVPASPIAFPSNANADAMAALGRDIAPTVQRSAAPAVAFDLRGRDGGAMLEGPNPTASIRAASGGSSRSYVVTASPVAFDPNQITSAANRSIPRSDVCHTMPASSCPPHLASPMAVRRLTPIECERLQGFPDGYTAVPYRGKSADRCPDSPRYKALGNSMAVPVMRWIGKRIAMVDAIAEAAP